MNQSINDYPLRCPGHILNLSSPFVASYPPSPSPSLSMPQCTHIFLVCQNSAFPSFFHYFISLSPHRLLSTSRLACIPIALPCSTILPVPVRIVNVLIITLQTAGARMGTVRLNCNGKAVRHSLSWKLSTASFSFSLCPRLPPSWNARL